jgi:hypothetical protein
MPYGPGFPLYLSNRGCESLAAIEKDAASIPIAATPWASYFAGIRVESLLLWPWSFSLVSFFAFLNGKDSYASV